MGASSLTASEHLTGVRLLADPALNKGTAFTEAERTAFQLHGLLPPQVETLEQQVSRAYRAYQRKQDDLERHINLRALQDTNEVLFHALLLKHLDEMLPVIYTPVVALGCQQFSQIYRRPRGLFISYPHRGSVLTLLRNRPARDVDVIVVTDGERILGTGDQGIGGMGIPIGKLSLYTLLGGIPPERTLPVLLDVGTNNQERLEDPEYLGWRRERVTGEDYYRFVDEFVCAVQQELPHACLQWEDFATPHARPLLERYRGQLRTFNDDIQGTAAVALGALWSAVRAAGGRLSEQQIVFFGAGSSSLGVADYLHAAMVAEGLSEREARGRLWFINRGGLLHDRRTDLSADQQRYAQPHERVAGWAEGGLGLLQVVEHVPATALLGLSTVPGAFTQPVVRAMLRHTPRPIIFPLSNPTEQAEACADDLIAWSDGKALIACGSPFPPVRYRGRTIPISQCNNCYIFPAVGLGLAISGARRVTDGMMMAAARALAEHSPALRDPGAPLLPPLRELRAIALDLAVAVALEAQTSGLANTPPAPPEALWRRAAASQWTPTYD